MKFIHLINKIRIQLLASCSSRKIIFFGLAMFVFFLIPFLVHAQSYTEIFGQNRRQYRKFDWKYFDTKHFRVYHYDKAGKQLARYVAEEAEKDISLVEKKLSGQFPRRFNIVLYNSYEEYRQTNIGLKEESQVLENTRAGTVNLVGDKLVVYFTGKHTDLRHQILSSMAKVVMERLIFGENFKKMVKNALLLNLPEWVTEGFISYLVDGWDAKSNSEWKNLLEAKPKTGFYEFSEQYPELAGRAFWKFVGTEYNSTTVKNLLYSMQMRSSLNKGMKEPENLNMKVTKAYDSCIKFYKKVYAQDALNQEKPDSTKGIIAIKMPKNGGTIRNITVSPRGNDVSYVLWQDGQYSVCTQRINGEDKAVLLEGGEKDLTEHTDPDYPMLTYSNTGSKLAILYKRGPQTRLRIYNSQKGKIDNIVIPKNRFDRVLGFTFTADDDRMIFSAIKKSQTDLYMFIIKGNKMVNITDDVWDDIAPTFISGGSRTGVLFLSNRPKPKLNVPLGVNELPTGPMNVFFYNTKTNSTELLQCTNIKSGTISQPIQYGFDNFSYLYDGNGINNKYVVMFARDRHNMDSAYSVPVTNYNSNIISHQFNVASNEVADVVQDKNRYKVFFHGLVMPDEKKKPLTLTNTILSAEKHEEPKPTIPNASKFDFKNRFNLTHIDNEAPEIKGGNAFQSEFVDTVAPVVKKPKVKAQNKENTRQGKSSVADSSVLTEMTDSAYLKMKPVTYRLSFKPDFFSIRLDNSVLFSQYQSYGKNDGQYVNPAMGTLSTLSINELMENHRFTAGFQLPLDLSTSAYFLQYQNFTRFIDWGVIFLHQQTKDNKPIPFVDQYGNYIGSKDYAFKSTMDMIQADLSYPISRVKSIKFHTSLREEKLTPKSVDTISLFYLENYFPIQYWSFSRLEYVFDNTISPTQNIRIGTRYKGYVEYMYELNNGNMNCYNVGFDYRTYHRIYKNTIWATRVVYAHSDGNSEVEYQLGGVDNWFSAKQANSGASEGNPGFISLATNLRGYYQMARKGNNLGVANTEIRSPVLTTFIKRPIQSSLLKNLQLVGFVDAGSAWSGFLPDSKATSMTYYYPTIYSNPSPSNNVYLKVVVPQAGGLALGYGGGLRSMIFGYFLRLDLAWSIDNLPKKPVVYFSLGTDF